MKRTLLLLLLTSGVYTVTKTDQELRNQMFILQEQKKLLLEELRSMRQDQVLNTRYQHRLPAKKKGEPLWKRACIKIVGDTWDVIIAHLKRWYTALIIIILLWYRSNLPFPWRSVLAHYLS